jgi:pyruvate formate lyase activating enzyme
MVDALLWDLEGERIHCRVCPHECRIKEGASGYCGVRRNSGGVLDPTTYGKVSSVAVDPIEKKPVFHYRPGTLALSLGSVGCSMRCRHCQNWQISRATSDGPRGLQDLPVADVVLLAERHGCVGVAFTYNEPVIWIEYVLDVSRACKAAGLYTVMVTNGYITGEALDLIGEHVDVWRVDVKAFDDEGYRALSGVSALEPVLTQAKRAKEEWGMHVEVVTNVVPGFNDSDRTLRGIAGWIHDALGPGTPWHVTRFHPCLDLSHLEPTPLSVLRRGREIGREAGLRYVFLGNVAEPGGEDTLCPDCGNVVIGRAGFDVVSRDLASGTCRACGCTIQIVT